MKNNKIKIENGSEKLTPEEINSHKDFSKVYKSYTTTTTKTSTSKTPGKAGGITKTVVVTTIVTVTTIGAWKYWSSKKTTTQPKAAISASASATHKTTGASTSASAKHPFINPPLKGVDVPYKTYTVDANKGGIIMYNNSKIAIPSGAFCDENGNDITGKVMIKYREFHNAVEFFASGIPMTYDSAGKQYTFESAGMMDIRGYQNGKPAYIKTGKEIQVSMVSTQTKESYNLYELDTVKQNWNYLSKSKSVPLPVVSSAKTGVITDTTPGPVTASERQKVQQVQNEIADAQQAENKIEKTKPVAPEKAVRGKNTFDIEADAKDYPELAVYKKVLWEPDVNDKNYKPSYSAITWDDASLARNKDSVSYTFTVKKGAESHSFIVHPVFEGTDYALAMNEYNKKYDEYQAALNKRKADERKAEEAYEALLVKIKKEQEEFEKQMAAERQESNTSWTVVDYLEVHHFGIYNCDNPKGRYPEGANLKPQYTDNNNDSLNIYEFWLVEKGKNAIYNYPPMHHCLFNPHARNFAWMVTPGNKIAIYSIDDFKNINQTKGNYTFILKVADKKIVTMDDLNEIFKPYL